ncbi:BZ3500_MvSof-1268-A1-R1_Chr2-3g05261 [Microbotryum saponariae]|uniref:BZ3500_MvSof-1268-A1-R1_Chr2-3g05261 protein n=1 Tax=Microbotryum saponariae TaxID=289078 RepID=A0A2X0N897_9BASI|nr:BZ3500_MvSof-1268-A1-R1_Chr2-3g05261 [Microbotryum saponariae]SDA01087.1 BZ3501_MvSof-1269-A2-R1_Chr2-2g04934 [Microbotryum saponariae]
MVQLLYTPPLETRLEGLELPQELRDLITSRIVTVESSTTDDDRGEDRSRTISHEVLVRISKWSKKDEDRSSRCSLASLLALTDVYAPPLKPREKSPELLAILAKIQLDQDRESYKAMTSTGPTSYYRSTLPMKDLHDPEFAGRTTTEAEDWQLVRKQVSAIANVGASMAAVGTGVWWVGGGRTYAAVSPKHDTRPTARSTGAFASWTIRADLESELGTSQRLVLALTGAVLIGLIETFLYYRFFTREKGSIGVGLTKTKRLRFEKLVVPDVSPFLLGAPESSAKVRE